MNQSTVILPLASLLLFIHCASTVELSMPNVTKPVNTGISRFNPECSQFENSQSLQRLKFENEVSHSVIFSGGSGTEPVTGNENAADLAIIATDDKDQYYSYITEINAGSFYWNILFAGGVTNWLGFRGFTCVELKK